MNRRIYRGAVLAVLLLVGGPGALIAQEPDATTIITALAPETQIGPSPGVIVVEIDEIRRGGDTTVADVVDRIPGLQVQRTGSSFESSTLRIRGSSGEQVLVLRDGVPLADGRSSAADLSSISLAGVKRIVITLGPATAQYGIGGAAGAINLITVSEGEQPSGSSGSGRLTWGSFGEYRLAAATTVSGTTDRATHTVDVTAAGVGSDNTYQFERSGRTVSRRNAGGILGSGDLSYRRRSDVLELTFDGAISAFDRGLPGTVEFPSFSAQLTEERVSARVSGTYGGSPRVDDAPGPSVSASAGIMHSGRTFRDDEYPLGALKSESRLTAVDGKVGLTVPVGPVSLSVPLSVRVELLEDRELGNPSRQVFALAPAVETALGLPGLSEIGLALTGRGEVEFNGSSTAAVVRPSGRGSIGWTAAYHPVWTGLAVAGGYRLPDFAELFTEGSAFAVGNPDLEPEQSVSYEWEVRLGDRYVQPTERELAPLVSTGFRTALFYTEYKELIQWLPDPTGFWRPRNTGAARMYGVETDVAVGAPVGLTPWNIGFVGGVDILQAQERSEGVNRNKYLPYRPQLTLRGELAFSHLRGHRLYTSILGRGARPVTRQNTVWLDPYVDLSFGAAITVIPERVNLAVEARNLTDERYVETRFYPNPGREFRISLEVVW